MRIVRACALAIVPGLLVAVAGPADVTGAGSSGPSRTASIGQEEGLAGHPGQPAGEAVRSSRVEVLRSTGAVPPEIVAELREPSAYVQADNGFYFVLDRRGHGVYSLDRERAGAWRVVQIGGEQGRIVDPLGFGFDRVVPTFVVLDMPDSRPRVQRFGALGTLLGGFYLPAPPTPPLLIGGVAVSGPGPFAYTGTSLLVSMPDRGALVAEFGMAGESLRAFGGLRLTGQERNPDVHYALNTGIPVPAPGGNVFFVFQAGSPVLRKYDGTGRLLFERHIEGPEIDPILQSQPTSWPRKTDERGRQVPLVVPVVRTAAADRAGNVWVSLTAPFTYVYNPQGERIRVIQFSAAGIVSPTSFFFTNDGRLLITPGCYDFHP